MKAGVPAWGRHGAGVAALVAAAVWIYWPALHGTWLWDDGLEIAGNPVLRDPAGLLHAWTLPAGPDYLPLKDCLQWLQWHLWQGSVFGYHLTNVALHGLAAVLAWRVFAQLRIRQAWLGAAVFAVHPLAVESVAWIAEMKNELSLVLALACLLAWMAYERGRRARDRAFALVAFALAMLAKSAVVMLPFVLLGYLAWKRGKIERRDLIALIPFFIVAATLGWITVHFQASRAMATAPGADEGFVVRLLRAPAAELFYLGKFLWPARLMPIYPRFAGGWLGGLAWLAGAAAGVVAWRFRGSWGRHALFGLGAFAILLLPALGIIPMAFSRISWVSDHLAYLALVPLAGLVAALCVRRGIIAGVAIAGVLGAMQSHRLAGGYSNELVFWSRAAQANPQAWMAHSSLGLIAYREGLLEQAIGELRRAAQLEPGSAEVHNDLGLALFDSHHPEDAVREFREALRLAPRLATAHNNLANAWFAQRDLPAAVGEYEAALREGPGDPAVRKNLAAVLRIYGAALGNAGKYADAAARFEEAVDVEPDSALAHQNLGLALRAMGRDAEAKTQFDLAARLASGPTARR